MPSNVAHELAHLLEHEPGKVILSPDGGAVMRTFDARQEEEAGWLSGCLLLPRVALLRAARGARASSQIAKDSAVTEVLLKYRLRMCGVPAQVRPTSALSRRRLSA